MLSKGNHLTDCGRIMKEIQSRETVLFYDTDCGGVVSNIAYLRYVERARCHLFEALGMPLSGMESSGVFPAVSRSEIDYLVPGKLGDTLLVSARLAEVGKVRVECEYEIVREDGKGDTCLLARAKQVVVLLKLPSGRPQRTPEEWRGGPSGETFSTCRKS